jgi:uncharacterized protein (TIGR02246 family)
MTTAPTPTQADKNAIAALPSRISTAWAAHDATAFAAVFTEDGSMVLPHAHCRGREAIHTFMTEGWAGPYKGTKATGTPLDLRFLNADVALLTTRGGVLQPGETEVAAERSIIATWVAVNRSGEWLLAAYHNSPS